MRRTFAPLSKNQQYLVEEDFLDRANVDIIRDAVKYIDAEEQEIGLKGMKKPIKFEKLLIAWGHNKARLAQEYPNVHYIEDKFSHAKIHNNLLRAKKILVMGNTFESYQVASSVREYLDSLELYDKEIILMTDQKSELRKTCSRQLENYVANSLYR